MKDKDVDFYTCVAGAVLLTEGAAFFPAMGLCALRDALITGSATDIGCKTDDKEDDPEDDDKEDDDKEDNKGGGC